MYDLQICLPLPILILSLIQTRVRVRINRAKEDAVEELGWRGICRALISKAHCPCEACAASHRIQ